MRVTVFGAGAIGGHLALRCALGGAEVAVVARGQQLDAFRAHGIRVEAPDGTHHASVRAEARAADLPTQDVVIVTVKNPALREAAQAILPLLGPETVVVFVQNGIPWWYPLDDRGPLAGQAPPWLDPDGTLRARFGDGHTVGGVVWSGCTVTEPGSIRVVSVENRLFLGRPDDRPDPRAASLAQTLDAGGMKGILAPSIREAVWTKLLGNLSQGPLSVATTAVLDRILDVPELRAAVIAGMHEAKAIAAAAGVALSIDPEARVTRSRVASHRASIAQDLLLGRPLEIAALFDAPLWMARRLGVPTPTLDLLVAIARLRASEAGLYARSEGGGAST